MTAGFLIFLVNLLVIGIQLAFAYGIYQDGLKMVAQGDAPKFAPPVVWGLATVIGGFPILVLYWVIHYSRLKAEEKNGPSTPAVEVTE